MCVFYLGDSQAGCHAFAASFPTSILSEPPRKHESSRGTHAFAAASMVERFRKRPRKHGTPYGKYPPKYQTHTPRRLTRPDFHFMLSHTRSS